MDPEGAKAAAAADVAIACALLRELVNYSTHAWAICAHQMPEGRDEGIAPLRLYYHVIEMVDAVEVLLRDACVHSAAPLLRSQWEAYVQLAFMLRQQQRYREATVAWVVGATREKLRVLDEVVRISERDPNDRDPEAARMARERITLLESALTQPHLAAVAKRMPKKRPWYQPFGGGANIEQLSAALARLEKEQGEPDPIRADQAYLTFYRFGSTMVHASDFDRVMSRAKDGVGGRMEPLRGSGKDLLNIAALAAGIALATLRHMMTRFAPERRQEVSAWYVQRVQERLRYVSKMDGTLTRRD